ncbi:bis(5'-adenosyl)-triphosphatase enpp4-like [Ruditapes philippinarum]|uniref:bis(5'-adenosyl)-triphosphatase enpp4-like n=1 Tax=Ruditapes philippinarum TaxID=129788 RepID=UPI00295AC57A|nr:bis(5'-adenosyl)-triphosphatase enpp4-like [Ruditapes philippinarum]
MNIILTSDHGLGNYNKSKTVLLNDYLNSSWYKTGSEDYSKNGNRITVNIFPEKGKEDTIYEALRDVKYLKVYRKGDDYLVNTLHYNSSDRIAPIVITASEEGVLIFPTAAERDKHTEGLFGVHGYDPHIVPNMRPFFIAMGPAFKKGYISEHFNSVDIYPLMCHILGIEPAPNNGSLDNVKGLLMPYKMPFTKVAIVITIGLSVTMAAIYVICVCYNARTKSGNPVHGSNMITGFTSLRSPTHHLLNSEDEDDEF